MVHYASALIPHAAGAHSSGMMNAFVNYTVKGSTPLRGTKLRLSVNNLLDEHNIVGITAANSGQHPAVAPGDVLTLLPARSVMMTVTFGFAPNKR